jgi:rubrerythrin
LSATSSEPTAAAVRERLLDAWRDEVQATVVYGLIADREGDPQRAAVLRRLAEVETSHRARLEARMRELGIEIPDPASVSLSLWQRLQARVAPVERLIAHQESMELEIAAQIEEQPTGDALTDSLLEQIKVEEEQHTEALGNLRAGRIAPAAQGDGPAKRLERILKRETWHRDAAGWIPGAIYGANDGLAAVFGIVAGVSGATGGTHVVLTAGLFGAIASALSMATGAFLAERSTNEVAAKNLAREREEVARHPEEEKEELALYYQLKGLTVEESRAVVERIAQDPEQLFRGVRRDHSGDPVLLAARRHRDRRRGGRLACRALRGRRGEVDLHAAQCLVGRNRNDVRGATRRRRDLSRRPRDRLSASRPAQGTRTAAATKAPSRRSRRASLAASSG